MQSQIINAIFLILGALISIAVFFIQEHFKNKHEAKMVLKNKKIETYKQLSNFISKSYSFQTTEGRLIFVVDSSSKVQPKHNDKSAISLIIEKEWSYIVEANSLKTNGDFVLYCSSDIRKLFDSYIKLLVNIYNTNMIVNADCPPLYDVLEKIIRKMQLEIQEI